MLTTCKPELDNYIDPYSLIIQDIKVIPEKPNMREPTKIVFTGCDYFKTYQIIRSFEYIYVKKRFNSVLKWNCKLKSDTISLKYLFEGTHKLVFEIIDINPDVKDSVFYSTTKMIPVTRERQ
jgi:hypothetical protein